MPAVVRVQVEQNVRVRAARNDQRLLVIHRRGQAERAVVLVRLLPVLDVDHAVRGPEALERVGNRGEIRAVLELYRHLCGCLL
ncbi:hypothetical protein D3C84_1239340 [compost metagenome]